MLRKIYPLIIIILLTGCTSAKKAQRYSFIALNTSCSLTVYHNRSIDFKKVEELIKEFETRVSFHIKGSDISRLNAHSGSESIILDDDLVYILNKSILFGDLSDGYFDITTGPVNSLWGFGLKNYLPTEDELERLLPLVNYKNIEVEGNKILLKEKGMEVDLGAIAKGYISDYIKEYLESIGVKSAIISLGGNVTLVGKKRDAELWRIGIQSPKGPRGKELGYFRVENRSVISSGDYERFFEKDGVRYHHILNPFTGYPKRGEIVGSTIVCEAGIDGDALSTITFGLSIDEIISLRDKFQFEGVFVRDDGGVYVTEKLQDIFTLTDNRYRLIGD